MAHMSTGAVLGGTALGQRGRPAEDVGLEAVTSLLGSLRGLSYLKSLLYTTPLSLSRPFLAMRCYSPVTLHHALTLLSRLLF